MTTATAEATPVAPGTDAIGARILRHVRRDPLPAPNRYSP